MKICFGNQKVPFGKYFILVQILRKNKTFREQKKN